jgi:hypothetical protein
MDDKEMNADEKKRRKENRERVGWRRKGAEGKRSEVVTQLE